ncbi:Splicing factor 3B subunit 2 [Neolecta irregularis DAH-3]|uniref:Splicing factor 3B subunit 2 n=1 Tax=Neolecta irregularis (strain DAH-3) TaxID=1198029 RepID=A0A1U7LQA0_NEOID|nr:Splicing factor 3B subunit 2 [Neolecta irregularis DAH-3]|eukprot:OLL24850.1 Splicing factor 3B subunit 2 [Neolecta irregularis DAH-3]
MPVLDLLQNSNPDPSACQNPSRAQLKRLKRRLRKKPLQNDQDDLPQSEESSQPQSQKLNQQESNQQYSNQQYQNHSHQSLLLDIDHDDPTYSVFKHVLDKFYFQDSSDSLPPEKGQVYYSDDGDVPSEEDQTDSNPKLSKKKAKRMNRMTVAELKQQVKHPDLVEWTDVSAPDPKLLLHLKSARNAVPVPAHWAQKRDYLASKKGVEKPPFELPDFIRATGIAEMRDSTREREENQTLRQKMRAKVQPKMGKLDIDYQKLHDAFFRFQTKPHLTDYGEVYYEGKEYEANLKDRRPGDLSDELKDALSIPPGAPPPWLINMQRFGPPPSYPALKIPGLNAPLPHGIGALWGYHPGGWGKPPVDEYNRPLYGDVFGTMKTAAPLEKGEPIQKVMWGEIEDYGDEDDQEEDDNDQELQQDVEMAEPDGEAILDGLATPSGIATPSGFASSVPSGIETPDFIELRKQRAQEDDQAQLYTILPEKEKSIRGFMGSQHGYDMSSVNKPPMLTDQPARKRKGDVDVAIDPEALESGRLSKDAVKAAYDGEIDRQKLERQAFQEDLSDMVTEHSQRQNKKIQQQQQQQQQQAGKSGDKKREKFKF